MLINEQHYQTLHMTYLFTSRLPLLVLSIVLNALEEHFSTPLRRCVACLHDRIGFVDALWLRRLTLILLRCHAEVKEIGTSIGGALAKW